MEEINCPKKRPFGGGGDHMKDSKEKIKSFWKNTGVTKRLIGLIHRKDRQLQTQASLHNFANEF